MSESVDRWVGPQRPLLLVGVLIASVFAEGVFTAVASAQEVQVTGPLAGAPACRKCRVYREGRFQLQPFIAFSLQDEFSRSIPLGAQLTYHVTDWLGIGLWGAWGGLNLDTGLTGEVEARGQTTERNRLSLPNANRFPDQIGKLDWFAAVQLTLVPLRGKLALFQEFFVDTDFYVSLGVAFIGVDERAAIADGSICTDSGIAADGGAACSASQLARESRIALAPTAAVGLMLHLSELFGISIEWRAFPLLSWNTSGTDEAGGGPGNDFPDQRIDEQDRIVHFNHMVTIGFAFSLPAEVSHTP